MAELTGWMFLGLAALSYSRFNAITDKASIIKGPKTDREIDVTRWRHDGQQPVYYKDGNQPPFVDEQVKQLAGII